ncbi:MAG TPA: hypothetical protein VL171_11620 [Verrucomicrobiae bacterium]|nr:hypothetical protein [Verrucomicrobiae bacterium]
MSDEQKKIPDHTLQNADIKAQNEPPMVFAVSDLRAYVKPDLAEELGSPAGGLATCGTEVVCACVPVETCACNTVSYNSGGSSCPSNCSCVGNTCVGLYWFPY